MNDQEASERATLERLSKNWSAQGFQVLLEPRGSSVPDFLQKYRPDAILSKDGKKVIVEIIRKGHPNAEEKIRRLKTLIEGQKEWRLEVVYSGEQVDAVRKVEQYSILEAASSAESLLESEPRAALLLMWATLEATARSLFPNQTNRPQSPGRVIELLAGSGEVTPAEASLLQRLMQWRNKLVHGDLDIVVVPSDVNEMVKIVRQLVERVQT